MNMKTEGVRNCNQVTMQFYSKPRCGLKKKSYGSKKFGPVSRRYVCARARARTHTHTQTQTQLSPSLDKLLAVCVCVCVCVCVWGGGGESALSLTQRSVR
jgi:hypothetical protein